MKGFIYIAGSFHTVRRGTCGGGAGWIDNDPHFWTDPPTWGICRNDLRRRADVGDHVFYVLPKAAKHPQCIFAHLRIVEPKITHHAAYHRRDLRSKRMGNKNPNGNIIVDASGRYNRYDAEAHRHMFDRIKDEYAIGCAKESRLLSAAEIDRLAPAFTQMLQGVLGIDGATPIELISRYGRTLNPSQVRKILDWLDG